MGELGGSVSLAVATVGHFQKAMPGAISSHVHQFTPTLATTNVNALIPQLSSINTQMAVLFPLMGVVAASIAMMQCSLANSNELSGVTGSTMQVLSVRSLDPSLLLFSLSRSSTISKHLTLGCLLLSLPHSPTAC